ncbi:alkaline phosphatase family protein [Amycolatopsis sp. NPDC051071]|uniref:alkaline phosphatase family protein n=1 Tax=Amycolatopsis sp. NPDC051071 TaxID=3154637 RepID=UPI0034489D00
MRARRVATLFAAPVLALLALTAVSAGQPVRSAQVVPAAASIPQFDHVVIVMFENKNYTDIKGSSKASYLNSLASQGTLLGKSYGVTHPSQPNYVGLFSGTTAGVHKDDCLSGQIDRDNIGNQLVKAGKTFKGYSEGLPKAGSTTCKSGRYARKHAPWAFFKSTSGAATNVPYSAFPSDYSTLPTVSFVIPDMCNDMHDCSVSTGDSWLKKNLDGYAQWAKTHNSLLIATFDEDNFTSVNQIYTAMVGAHVKAGYKSETQANHYTVLRTLEDMYGLPPLAGAANKQPITDIWTA